MRKRLVRKAFDMILGISLSENKDVSASFPYVLYLEITFVQGCFCIIFNIGYENLRTLV